MTTEEMVLNPELWVNKIICRYKEGHSSKIRLHNGEDRVLIAEVIRLRTILNEIDKDNIK